jgi:hypothetical protein
LGALGSGGSASSIFDHIPLKTLLPMREAIAPAISPNGL